METLLLILMLAISILISWILVGRKEPEAGSMKKYLFLAIGYGVANGAIFAGAIALINLLQYHTLK
ncbi:MULTISPECIES: hypothetical protein [Carboxydocella]|uniref:Uncharacterized protein n=2 Tax=Carboxydocella TaxID=178898 RepID=A0A1T4LLU1_9FIRM|nr:MULTISPECIES: hypothetical protein [Carboxydocella]AVX20517.1 hypothetical protein CFE_1328 [Carboxydocella thermautotrophica]AVX30939.1 hypothetical protein CTH_1349 [Carboxydocella thermautotrophica]SJZ55498.1 hypothetical protein SAMN02745885_00207 [Carboxydocella sporoproducens DSM 16521]GAW29665.1 hypothetical protein ULO1_22350 [Carboxydocella sp. ULO1]GAW31443.1 hypothetical protein JDF658_12080 [Carboxydocella sp. JDF658]